MKFLVELIDDNNLDIHEIIDSIELNYGEEYNYDINTLIYKSLSTIAYRFINENQELFEDKSEDFETFINYLDSHIRFRDEEVQSKFEKYLK